MGKQTNKNDHVRTDLPVQTSGIDTMPMELEVVKERLAYIEQFCREILKEKTDYGKIPGTGKPTLFKPGAEKLCYAFNMEPTYQVVEEENDPWREWTWKKQYTDRNTGEVVVQEMKERGFYAVSVLVTLRDKTTGAARGSHLGSCLSSERGRESSPHNTILKMASKRAYVGAVLNATFTSERFTQDLEDFQGDQKNSGTSDGKRSGGRGLGKEVPSKYGTSDKPVRCNFCTLNHIIKGDMIVRGLNSDGVEGWGSLDCVGFEIPSEKDDPDRSAQSANKRPVAGTEGEKSAPRDDVPQDGGKGDDDLPF